jgi:hypothetical protein
MVPKTNQLFKSIKGQLLWLSKIIFFVITFNLICLIPSWGITLDELSEKKIVTGDKTTDIKFGQLINYLELWEANYKYDKNATKWVKEIKDIGNGTIQINDDLTTERPYTSVLIAYSLDVRDLDNNLVRLDKIITKNSDGSNETKDSGLEVFLSDAKKNNFELPSKPVNKEKTDSAVNPEVPEKSFSPPEDNKNSNKVVRNGSLANHIIVIGDKATDIKISQLIYYLEQFKADYGANKDSKWLTNKKYLDNDKVTIEDNLPSVSSDGSHPGFTLELKENKGELKTVKIEKIIFQKLKNTSNLEGKDLESLISDAKKNNFELPSNNTKNVVPANNVSNESQQNQNNNSQSSEISWKTWAIIIFIIVILILFQGLSTACPKCRKWYRNKFINKTEISRRNSFKTVTESTTHRNKQGQITGTSTKEKKIPITLIKYQRNYQCTECNHEWYDTAEVEA